MVATLTLTQDGVTDIAFRAVRIDNYAQPYFVDGDAASAILRRLTPPEES